LLGRPSTYSFLFTVGGGAALQSVGYLIG